MKLFAKIENGFARLVSKGVTKEAPLFHLDGVVYAKHGMGYIRLRPNGGTSVPAIKHTEFHISEGTVKTGTFDFTWAAKAVAAKRPKLRSVASSK
jgi:hypothetical protein